MTADEKIKGIKELERQFLAQIDDIRKEYSAKITGMISELEQKKIEALKKELGI
jgi:hypothetical protein